MSLNLSGHISQSKWSKKKKRRKDLPISKPFLATLQTTEAGVMIAGSVFDRSNGGIILRELLPPAVCAARAAAAALKLSTLNQFKYLKSFFFCFFRQIHLKYVYEIQFLCEERIMFLVGSKWNGFFVGSNDHLSK